MPQPVDIVFLSSPALGGAERILRTISEETAHSGQDVVVVFLCSKGHPEWSGMPDNVTCLYLGAPKEKLGLLYVTGCLLRLRRKYSVRRVYSSHVHLNGMLCVYRLMGLIKCDSLVLRESTVTGDRFKGLRKLEFLLFYFFYRGVDLLICQTDYMKKRLLEFVPRLVRYSPEVIPNPVNVDRVVRLADAEGGGEENYGRYVVAVGRLIETKGLDVLVKAFGKLLAEYPDFKLLLIGNGSARPEYETLVSEQGIADKVIFMGHKENPFPYLKAAELGVISSRREGFPNVLLEMMAVCKRVASTRCAGGIDKIPGIFHCEAGNVDALYSAMKQAMEEFDEDRVGLMREEVQRRSPAAFLERVNGFCSENS